MGGRTVMERPHAHPDVEVNFLRKGSLRYFLNGRFLDVRAGEAAVFWAGMPHQTLEKYHLEGIWMTIPLPWLLSGRYTRELAGSLLRGELIVLHPDATEQELFERWRRDFSGDDRDLREIAKSEIGSYFSRISVSRLRAERPPPDKPLPAGGDQVENVLNYLAGHYHEEISVEDIARVAGLHPKYLLVLFRRTCRMTLWEYVLKLRLAHAQRLLLTTDRTVADIAFDAGFNSLTSFYHAFRKHVPAGTPVAFRAGGAV